ncbi:hypothetical protein Trydic_g13948 [Trypoxylus dichotomus]
MIFRISFDGSADRPARRYEVTPTGVPVRSPDFGHGSNLAMKREGKLPTCSFRDLMSWSASGRSHTCSDIIETRTRLESTNSGHLYRTTEQPHRPSSPLRIPYVTIYKQRTVAICNRILKVDLRKAARNILILRDSCYNYLKFSGIGF